MWRLLIIISLMSIQCGIAAAKLSPADSIRRLLPNLHGQTKLNAISNICDIIGNGNNEMAELKSLDEYTAEARRQKNVDEEVYSLGSRMCCLCNYNDEKRRLDDLPAVLDVMEKNKRWDDYYEAWCMLPYTYLSENKLRLAIIEAKKIYDDARSRKSNYGLGTAEYIIGRAYYAQENIPESDNAFKHSLALLKMCNDRSILFNVYTDYCDVLFLKSDYKRIKSLTAEWKKTLDSYMQQYKAKGLDLSSFNIWNKFYYLASARLNMNTGHLNEAGLLLTKAAELVEGGKDASVLSVLQDMTEYYRLKKDFKTALKKCREWIDASIGVNDKDGLDNAKEKEAEILISMGRPAEAAYIYNKLLPHKDSMFSAKSKSQLDELNTIYKLDEIKLSKERMKNYIIIISACCIILIIFFTLYIIYLRRLRHKNMIIYERMKNEIADYNRINTIKERIPEAELSSDERIYKNLCRIVNDKELFKDPNMNREQLASELGTNYTYINSAINNCEGGISVTEFINRYRINYAAKLMEDNSNLSINTIGDLAGFNSRSSYYRHFKNKFGMSPSEYKKVIISQKEKFTD